MIKSDQITLRAFEKEDYIKYNQWINDPETNYWRGNYPPQSLSKSQDDLNEFLNDSKNLTLAIISNNTNQFIGLIGLRSICYRSRRCEIWIYIGDKTYWNQGYGSNSLKALIDYAFNELNLHRIWLECDANYDSAIRCYLKVGFVKEGILKDGYYKRGKYHDTMIMGLIKKYI